ncbi:hypothetical protein EDD18DRAFT_1369414 [Armillaria luteobubalina]|uniref:Uncharacterized protein n=1 Tax=Armillaria luteobubalina TaxID=153913 RepID=A0AA39NWK0_9AGAR|nr:hypothetical protein EDD18DRAFT_1369414 [Armillaria luteobubalina]
MKDEAHEQERLLRWERLGSLDIQIENPTFSRGSWPTLWGLHILELMVLPSADMKDVLGPHGPHNHSLHIFRFSNTAASILRSCVNLKEFVLSSLLVMGLPLVKLPESIELFSLTNSYAMSTEWSPFI